MTIQHILTLSIEAIALSFVAMMTIDFAYSIASAWCKSSNPKPSGMRSETLAPIFESIPEFEMCEASFGKRDSSQKCRTGSTHLIGFSIRELKKQASVAKIKNYSVLTKAQLITALSA